MDESLDKRTGLNPDTEVGEALTCESTQNQEQGILESVQAEQNSPVDLLNINEASTSQITEPSPASYERFTCTNVTLSETDKAAGFAQNYDLISTRNLSPFPVSDQNITDFVSESLQRINSAVSSDSQKTITNSSLDVEDEFSSGPVTKERKIDDSLPNHLKSETIPVQNFDSMLESSSLNAEDIEKLVRSSLNVSRLLESSEGAGSAEGSLDNSQKAKVKVENLLDVATLDSLHTQGDNSIVNPENLNPPKIFTVSSAEQLHYESDTPASSASSMSSSYATGDTCGSDCLPANCSLAYACNTSEAEDLSKSQYQGLSGHLMDYYLTMVFPGQPGPLSHLCPDVASAPIEPVFQIGEELIQKSPLKPEEEDDYDSEDRRIILGICAMEKKSRSKPMLAILERLAWFEFIETHIFAEKVILNEPVECWPICDVFVSFHSRGFPLNKAIDYVKLRKPIVVNDLDLQYTLQDRRDIHKILEKEGIPQPRYMIVNRDIPNNGITDNKELPLSDGSFFQELEDSVELDGEVFQKPFVEKPVSAEDHNVYIYFPTAAGGGSQRLFRKVGSRSSIYSNYTRVRKAGSYIYEDFMPTDGTDVKVYTVGPDYAHAEARKSPGLDGKVERDQNGKEIRYPVILSANEKMIARKVTLAFKQTVCGFDLLRANGKSFVCDVNGFSFVKTSSKYYDDCAKVLGTMIMRALAPQLHIPWVLGSAPEDIPVVPTTSGTMMELRCVTAVIRHGDRTPKQKMKMEVKQKRTDAASSTLFERFFDLFEKYDGYRTGQLKLKQPKQLQEVLDIVRQLLQEHQLHPDPEIEEKKAKLEQLKLVLEMYGYFSGINRKVQLKYQPHGRPKKSSSEDEISITDMSSHWLLESKEPDFTRNSSDLLMYEFTGINRKVQLKDQPYFDPPLSPSNGNHDDTWDSFSAELDYEGIQKLHETPSEPSLLLIVKWGGELTPAGKIQAEQLGKAFRSLYPGGQGEYGAPGLGILRLHSTYRHDLKMYASDEGRVQMTAAAFAKGLLALEGELPPILVQMVKCANTNGLLDSDGETSKYQHVVKEKLKDILNQDRDFTELDYVKLAPNLSQSLLKAMRYIKNPYQMCEQVHTMVKEITSKIRRLKIEQQSEEKKLYHGETWGLLLRRWAKLEKDFKMKSGYFDINKIPDIYDCIKYDLQHNQKVLQYENSELLHKCSKALADIVIPQEYGITKEEKLHISQSYCTPLLRKIRSDLAQVLSQDEEDDITRLDSRYSKGVATPHRFVRTRLYFTSESHIHSLLTMLRYGGLLDEMNDEQWRRAMEYVGNTAELNYMTQIVIMMYEDPSKEYTSEERFHVELHFSPGAYSWDNESQPDIHTTKSLSDKPDPSSIQCKRISMAHRPRKVPSCSTIPDRDENVAVETITAEVEEMKAPTKKVHLPKSPDPNVPEWDWGEDDLEVKNASQGEKSKLKVTQKRKGSSEELEEDKTPFEQDSIEEEDEEVMDQSPISRPTTEPISIANDKPAISISDADDSRSQSLEEKRSQSFEEKSQGEEACSSAHRPRLLSLPPSPERMLRFYTRMRGQRSLSLLEVPSSLPMVERHYLTVQLPLVDPKQKHRHSFANIFTVPGFIGNPDSFRETFTKLYVPSIQPLETLYNSLTLHQLDIFLDRITSVKFMTPASTPPSQLMSPCQGSSPRQEALQLNIPYSSAYSLSSAVNSNMGPPLDTTEDVLMKLRVFMMEKQFSTDTSVYTKIQRDKQSVSFTGYDNPHSHQLSKDGELQKDLGLGPLKGRQGQVHQNIAALASNRSGKLCHVKDCTVKQHSKGYHPHHVHEPHRATKPQTHAKPYRKYICKIFGKRVCPESVDQNLDENATRTTAQSATGKSWLAKVTEQFEDIGLAKEEKSTDTATKPILCQGETSWQQVNSATTSTGSGTSVDRKSKGHKKSQGRVHFLDEDLEKAREQKSAITKQPQSENTDSQKLTDPSKPNIELAPAGNTSLLTDNDAKHLCQKSSDGSSQV